MRKLIDKLSTNILRYLPAFLILLIPLIFVPLTPEFFHVNKQFLVFIVSSVALLFFCLRLVARGHIQISLSPALLPLAGLSVVYILSSLIKHPNPRFSLMNSTAVATGLFIIYLATTSTQKTFLVVRSIIIGTISSVVLLSVFSIFSHLGIIAQIPGPEWLQSKVFNPAGSPYNYLTLAVPVLLATISYGVTTRNWMIKPLMLAAAIIIASGSAFSLKLLLPTSENRGVLLLPYSAGWSIAVDTLKTPKTAILGTGPDTFTQVYSRLKPSSLNLDNNIWTIRFPSSSSELLNILTTTGVLGLLFFALSYLKTIRALLKEKYLSDPETAFLTAGVLSTFLLFILVPSSLPAQVMGIILLIASAVKLKLENSHSVKDVQLNLSTKQVTSAYSETPAKDRPGLPVLPWLLTVASVVLLAVFWNIASRTYAANLAIFEASQTVKDNQIKSYNKQIEASKLDPTDPYLKINLSQTYLAVTKSLLTTGQEGKTVTDEDKQKALEFANQALNEAKAAADLTPNDVVVWENLAGISRTLAGYGIEGSVDWTLATYTRAISLDPTNPTLRVQLGTFYFQMEDAEMAVRVLSQAIELKPNWNIPYYNLGLVYKSVKNYPRALAYMEEAKKYTQTDSDEMKQLDEVIGELKALVPKETAPTPTETK